MMKLRPYQNEAVNAVCNDWQNEGYHRTLVVLPTGCGKTVIFASVIARAVRKGRRALVIAHRDELLQQAHDKLLSAAGLPSVFEKAEQTAVGSNSSVVIGSIQTLQSWKRLSAFSPDAFDVIVVDEAHHVMSDSYLNVLGYFANAHVLGVTATPDRTDRKDLAKFFENTSYEYSLITAVGEHFLVPPIAKRVPLKIDISKVRVKAGEFMADDLGEALEKYLTEIAGVMAVECRGRTTVVFLPLVSIAKKFCECLTNAGMKAVEVDGGSPDRKEILDGFNAGKYDVICNAMLLTEGWDCPRADCIVVLRPTKSRALYVQMVGRGLRLSPETGKNDCLILDFLWITAKHDLVHPSAIIAKNEAVAQKMDNLPPDAELDLIQEAKKAEKSVEEERRKALSANIAANRQKKEETVSLVDFADAHGRADLLTWEPVHKWESQPASEKQLAWLRKYHIDTDGMTKGMASQLIDVINAPSRKQLNKLEDFGFEPAGWTKRDCNHVLDAVSGNRWRVPSWMGDPAEFNPSEWDWSEWDKRSNVRQ
ncbi:DEAD/DEAH box helicase [Enterococcus faecium]|uniref:DEAD/DEAH box helicase n=1 Tax=Enterococcus faecium TaxID=1352 RepID=UPI003DA56CA7